MNHFLMKVYSRPAGRFLLTNIRKINGMIMTGIVVAAASIVCIKWIPDMKLSEEVISSCSEVTYMSYISDGAKGLPIDKTNTITQAFVPMYDTVSSLRIGVEAFSLEDNQGVLLITINDENNTIIDTTAIAISELPNYGWQEIASDLKLEAGKNYSLSLRVMDMTGDGLKIALQNTQNSEISEVKILRQDGKSLDAALQMQFRYDVPLPAGAYLPYEVLTVLIAVFLLIKIFKYALY